MKLTNTNTNKSLKSKTLGLALAAVLIPGGLALAHDGGRPMVTRGNVSGHVEVVHEIPGGTVVVGADWGKPRPTVVVERREVVVVEKEHRHGRGHHRDREITIIREEPRRNVTIIREEPRRNVTIIRTVPVRPEVVVIEKREVRDEGCNRNEDVSGGNTQYYNDGKQVSVVRNDRDGQYQYYKDANQVSETRTDRSGTYKYYEDAHQVSIQDNRDGRNRNVYVQK
jgi:hypothetical protein